ncbi:MAG: hypothetical protein Q4C84_08375 [Bacillota bacterium]|nr:hypothetical protein [Bacillota bacterium]MDU3180539.1 hypothetical protein [Lachnospiraceae bacterium]
MKKSDVRKMNYIIDKNNDDEKEIYLKELSTSIHNYMKEGVKNSQLSELIELEEVFQYQYKQRFNITKIVDSICKFGEKIGKYIEGSNMFLELNSVLSVEQNRDTEIKKFTEQFEQFVQANLYEQIEKTIKDAAYLSHINMLYELYEQEEALRREEKEYEQRLEEFARMPDILKELYGKKRIEINELQKKVEISEEELVELLESNLKYFNIRPKAEEIQVSLSPKGKKYYVYIEDSQERYSKSALNQLIYKNCENIMESIERSRKAGIEFKLHLDEISPENARSIEFKYHKIIQKLIEENEGVYTASEYIMENKKEYRHGRNEKTRIEIPNTWEIY